MEKQRFESYLKVIENNDLIKKTYNKIAQLEIENKLDSDEASTLLSIIKRITASNYDLLKRYSPRDKDIQEFLILLEDMNVDIINDDYVEYIKNDNNIKLKKFSEQVSELEMTRYDFSEEDLLCFGSKAIQIDNKAYPLKKGLELLEAAGQDETVKEIRNIIDKAYEQSFNDEKEDRILEYNRTCLTHNLMMNFILEDIENAENKKYRKQLIKFKYNMLTLYDSLSRNFIKDPHNFIEINKYQNELMLHYNKKNKTYFEYYDFLYKGVINNILSWITTRDNQDINKFEDILVLAYLNTYTSLISSNKELEGIENDKLTALQLSTNEQNQILISDSLNYNNKLVLAKKLDK